MRTMGSPSSPGLSPLLCPAGAEPKQGSLVLLLSQLERRENNAARPPERKRTSVWHKLFARAVANIQSARGPHSWDTLYFWSGLSSLGDARKLPVMDWRLQYRKWEGIVTKTMEAVSWPLVPHTCFLHGVHLSPLWEGGATGELEL
jgi:hypothetical protein